MMKALVLHAVGDARCEQIPTPDLRPGTVRIRVGFCGVCGSDIPRVFVKGTYHFPTVCGHELAGTVEDCGAGVDDFVPGDLVAVFPLIWCGKCPACEHGKYVHCQDYDYLGSRSDGGFAEYVVAPRANLLKVPEGVSLEEASMTEPAAVALHALRQAGGCTIGETVVIFGAGPIGLMVAQWAEAMGATQVILFDIIEEKIEMAVNLGFQSTFDSRKVDPIETIHEYTLGQGADVCIEAVGCPPTTLQALRAARCGGRVVLLGNPSAAVTLPQDLISQILRRELKILGTWNSEYSHTGNHNDWSDALTAMQSGQLELQRLVTHRVSLEESFSALQMMRDRSEFYCKVLVKP
jgi:L-iditol 2-dehydrogenase